MPPRTPTKASVTTLESFYALKQAAEKLGLNDPDDPDDESGIRWLRDGVNHKGFPHHRMSRRLVFSDSDLAEIAALHRNAPTRAGRPRAARKPARAAA